MTPWYPTTNAPESGIFVAREAAALGEEHEVRVLHLDWTGDMDASLLRQDDVDARRIVLRRSRPFDFGRARRAVRTAAAWADVVHTHALTGLLPWIFGGRPASRPWVHSEHWSGVSAPETLGAAERAVLRALRPALARPDVVVAESERLAAAIRSHRRGLTTIVPCVVPDAVPQARPPGVVLVAVGGLIPRKGPLLAVGALAALRGRDIAATLTWVGDGPLREDVVKEAAGLGVADSITLTGTLDDAGVAGALDAASLFILPTQGDNFCVVAAEALVHGRPIVSGAATGAVDYASPAVSEFVAVQTPAAYADAIVRVHEKTRDLPAASVAASVAGRFTALTVRTQLEVVYQAARAR